MRRASLATHAALCGLSPPDTAPTSLLLSLLSPPLLSLPLVTLLLLLRTKPPLLLLLLLLLSSSLLAASTTGYSRRLCGRHIIAAGKWDVAARQLARYTFAKLQ